MAKAKIPKNIPLTKTLTKSVILRMGRYYFDPNLLYFTYIKSSFFGEFVFLEDLTHESYHDMYLASNSLK
jgi:hypothetical protein